MKKAPRPGFALAAIYPAVTVPFMLPLLQRTGTSDLAKGLAVGLLLGISVLFIILAFRPNDASDGC